MINAQQVLLFTAANLVLSIAIFTLNLLFFAKPLYAIYADLFQSGQMYQGETRTLMYNRFLLIVIAPCSFLLGSALTWVLRALKWIALVSTALILVIVLLVAAFLHLEPVVAPPATLNDHPDAHWSGAEDGGNFFEITQAKPPHYFLEIRGESGELWVKGWITYDAGLLNSTDFLGYSGEHVYLNNGTALTISEVSD